MGEHATARLPPTSDGAIGAAGGLLVAGGVLTFAGGESASRGPIAVAAIVLIVVGVVVRLAVATSWRAMRSAAVAVGAIAILVLAGTIPAPDSDSLGRTVLLLATIGYVVAWIVPGYRGHPIMLGLALLTVAGLLADLIGAGDGSTVDPGDLFAVPGYEVAAGRILLLVGLAYLVGVWFFDRRGYVGVGTAFAVGSLLTTTAGAAIVAADLGDTGGSLLLVIVGAVVCGVGARSGRRATAWWGAALCGTGSASLAISLFDPSAADSGGLTVTAAGLAMVAVATVVSHLRGRSDPPAPTAPSGPGAAPWSQPPPVSDGSAAGP